MKFTIEIDLPDDNEEIFYQDMVKSCCDEVLLAVEQDTCEMNIPYSIIGRNNDDEIIFYAAVTEEDIEEWHK